MNIKYCPKCKQTKLKSEFYKCPTRYDGVRAYCKECCSLLIKKNRDYYKEYAKKRYATDSDFKLKIKKSRLKYAKNNPKKSNAKTALYLAIKRGEIKKEPCFICSDKNSQGHHFDYKKKLDVIWLCPKHHRQIHTGRIDLFLQDLIKNS